MSLTSADKLFIERRERLTKLWPIAGIGCLVLIAVFSVWLWLNVPYLIDPWRVIESLESEALPESTMGIMLVMLPIVMIALLVFAFIIVLLGFAAFANERRMIRLLRKMEPRSVAGESNIRKSRKL